MAAIDLKALLGMAIKTYRASLGISQEELAYRASLHRTYVSDVERGARNPSVESIGKLARALEISVSKLFEQAADGEQGKQLVEILLVEDNPREVQVTLRSFQKARIKNPLRVVRDGAEALDFVFGTGPYARRAEMEWPQIILLDLNLPKKTALEVLRKIKADKRTQKIPVIVMTASSRDRDIAECRRLGAESCITKPVDFQNFSKVTPRLSLDWMLVKARTDISNSIPRSGNVAHRF